MGKTPGQRMYIAIKEGNTLLVRKILKEHPEELTGFPGATSSWLHQAASEGKREVIDIFLQAGLDVNYHRRADGPTPLWDAITSCQYDTAKYLLSLGADPSASRMLIAAINREGHSFALVKLLVEHGADVNECWRFGDEEKGPLFNALSWAIDGEKEDIAEYLRSKGATLPPAGPARPPSNLTEEVIAYFNDRVGPVKPKALVEIVPSSEFPVSVHVVPASKDRPYLTLFTKGMSEQPMTVPPGGEPYQFAELVIYLPADWPLARASLKKTAHRWPIDYLRRIAAYPHQEGTWLGGPITIFANEEPPKRLAPGCPFSAMLLAAGYDQVGPVQAKDGRLIQLYTLMPLYAEERALELAHGLPELFNRFDSLKISKVVDLKRPNVGK